MVRTFRFVVGILFLLSLLTGGSWAISKTPGVTITLTPSVQSPQFVGTHITWTATVSNGQKGHIYDYRFSVALQNQIQIVRDYDQPNLFNWVPSTVEGAYQVIVTVRDVTQLPYVTYAPVAVPYTVLPWVTSVSGSAVHHTYHPLVALFSGPSCAAGDTILVRFHQVNSDVTSTTNSVPCSTHTANFYVAGMLPSTEYLMRWEVYGPSYFAAGKYISFTTGPLQANYPQPNFQVNVPPTQHDAEYPVVLFGFFPDGVRNYWPTATDLYGNVIWYLPLQNWTTRMEPGGKIFAFPDDHTIFSEYDLEGNLILQTTSQRVSEQLVAQGYPAINDFNFHETRRLPNGDLLLLGSRDVISTMYQGGTQQNPVDILGDMILILDHNMQLVWAWDSFAHEDLSRKATLNDICTQGGGGCPYFNKAFAQANDWLHTNSAQLTPDGNIVLSQRAQDWVIKVNYQNGKGDGSVLWRMGPYGDFTLTNPTQGCGDPNVFPWFTHQHDAGFQPPGTLLGTTIMTVFDDGNLRAEQCGSGQNSRGMLLLVNEPTRTVYMETLADLGALSGALGSADQLLTSNGIYASFGNGAIGSAQSQFAQSTESNLSGQIVYELQADSWAYRTYRMQNLYTPTLP